jgi:hypothetical protein
MDGYTKYDLIGATFEEFVVFLFDHEVIPMPKYRKGEAEPWYWNAEVSFDPVRVTCDYIRLFSAPEFLLSKFSKEQLEQGFWEIQSPTIDWALTELIWNEQVPFVLREQCVRSMFFLYEKLFATTPLETAPNMLWDSLAYDWDCGIRSRLNGGEDEQMQDIMFETLGKILELPCLECQAAALHGLGHLHHPATVRLIDQHIQRNKTIDEKMRDYAHAAARFDVM